MTERVLIFKSNKGNKEYKITQKMRGTFKPKDRDCFVVININNYKDLSLFFHDLEDLWSAPVKKAAKQYLLDLEDDKWPF